MNNVWAEDDRATLNMNVNDCAKPRQTGYSSLSRKVVSIHNQKHL